MLKASDYFRRPRGSWRPRLRFPKASQGVRSPGAVLVDAESLARPPLADTSAFKKQRYLDSIPDEHSDAADAGLVPGIQYDPKWNEAYWMTRPTTVFGRVLRIGFTFVRWIAFKRMNGDEAAARYLIECLTYLGPAFVKIGQAIASRPDIVPPLYLKYLETLQDDIPPFPTDEAFATIEADLGAPVATLFSPLPRAPTAAASLGQVYRTKLKATGEEVAVKVQRPGLPPMIALDIFILRNLAKFVRRWKKTNSNLPSLIDEWASSIYREMSYRNEIANAIEFKELFAHYKEVYIPKMYPEYSSERVLTMEWVDGVKPRIGSANDLPPPSTSKHKKELPRPKTDAAPRRAGGSEADLALVEVGVRCSLEQMLQEGFYHADPHAGNLLRMHDGRLCYLDFGMMGRIDERTRQGLVRATLHMVNKEFEQLAEDFVTLGMLPNDPSRKQQIVRALTGVFNDALAGGVRNLNFGGLSTKLGTTMYEYKFQIPPYYTLFVRSLTILEGIALASDPNYKVLGAAYPWVARRLLTDDSPELRRTLRNLLYKPSGGLRFDRLEALLEQAIRSPPRPSRPLPDPNDSSTGRRQAPQSSGNAGVDLLLSDEGSFLRSIIVDELARGLDAAVRLSLDDARERLQSLLLGSTRTQGATRRSPETPTGVILGAAFASAPKLSDELDTEQMAGLQRIADLLQEIAREAAGRRPLGFGGSGGSAAPPAESSGPLLAAVQMLQWAVTNIAALPPAQQQTLLRVPVEVAARLTSRAAARTLKLFLSRQDFQSI